ncbi:MAG: tetratricopeptide repeat protein [Wenzhouxiangellaceae bacterium]
MSRRYPLPEILASTAFISASLVLILIALGFALRPIWHPDPEVRSLKQRRRALQRLREELDPDDLRRRLDTIEKQIADAAPVQNHHRGLTAGLLLAIPLLAVALYLKVGTPEGIDPAPGQFGDLRQMLGELSKTMREQPGNVEAWNRWGMIQKDLGQFTAAEAAFRRVLYNDPDDIQARVELAETLLFNSGQAELPQSGRELLESVLQDDPLNQKALWLAGLGAFHGGQPRRAVALWTRLSESLPEGNVKRQIDEQIERGRAALSQDGAPAQAVSPGDRIRSGNDNSATAPIQSVPATRGETQNNGRELPATDAAARADAIEVSVDLDGALAARIDGRETLFIFARATSGPPAPLAIKRLTAADLPVTVTLSDSDSMAAGLSLSRFSEVKITARISRSGNAIPAGGDLEGQTGPIRVGSGDPVRVRIDKVIQ